MRLFQNSGLSRSYRKYFDRIAAPANTFDERLRLFLDDRYGASHFLKPVLDHEPSAFVTNGDDDRLQRLWAQQHGLGEKVELGEILLAQIEEHRAEVFYNSDPMRYGGSFARRLPSCVKKKLCWRAAPSPGANFFGYDLVLCNFPSIIDAWRRDGLKAEYLAPAHDPAMDRFADDRVTSLGVVFVGGYSRHHSRRARVLEAVAELADAFTIQFALDTSRLTSLAATPLGAVSPLRRFRLPAAIRRVSRGPVFGRELYRLLSSAKIVFNAAIDMAGKDRGNMRCFEALGCGALMVSDEGNYPPGFVAGQTMLTYSDPSSAADVIRDTLLAWPAANSIANAGREMVRTQYSKDSQWKAFQRLVEIA
ncbi:MAG TPA: glycosyltransferase [Gemmatimonadaceae bacterium]|nr:glycosyltransferase [Gemmatimonadaceae bacterium]